MPHIIGFDTETILRNGSYQFFSAQFFSPPLKLNHFILSPSLLTKIFTRKLNKAYLLSVNAEYDVAVLRKVLPNDYVFKCLYNKSRFIWCKIYFGDYVFKVYDLRNIFPNYSLEKIGKVIGVEKLPKPDYLGLRPPQTEDETIYFIKYAMRDAEICYKAGEFILNKIGKIKPTAPSLAFYYYTKHFRKFGCYLSINEAIEEKIRLAYHGGRTESYVRGTLPDKVYVYDVKSLYPYIMATQKLPFVLDEIKVKSDVNLDKEGVAKVTVIQDADLPILATKTQTKDGFIKLVFPNGKFTGWFTYTELRYLQFKGLGKILKVYEAIEVDRSAYFFKEYVEHFYRLKESETEGRDFYKIMLNSLYGKFAERVSNPTIILTQDGKIFETVERHNHNGGLKRNLLFAVYITAKGRIYMHSLMNKLKVDDLCYTDTDSIHSLTPISFCGDDLGALEFKGSGYATYVRSKFYIFNDVVKCRGLQFLISAKDLKRLIELNKVATFGKVLLRVKSAFRRQKEFLTEVEQIKNFSIKPDYKRDYLKELEGKTLLTNFTLSKPLELNGD